MSVIQIDCPKCGGDGYLPQYSYINGGRCYKCDGTGKVDVNVKDDMDEFILDVFPSLYVEHEYSEAPNLVGEEKFYYQEARKQHNATLAKFLSGNEEFKESVSYIKEWAKKNHSMNPEKLYRIGYTSKLSENALGTVFSSRVFVFDEKTQETKSLLGNARFSVSPGIGFPDPESQARIGKDGDYDEDNTFLHEAIHYVDMVNQTARELGKPDSDKRRRVAQAKASVMDDYLQAVTGGETKLYEENVLSGPLAKSYIDYFRMEEILKFAKKNRKTFEANGNHRALAEIIARKTPNFKGGPTMQYRESAIQKIEYGDYDGGMADLEKTKQFAGRIVQTNLSQQMTPESLSITGGPDLERALYHLQHIPLQIAFKEALNDDSYMTVGMDVKGRDGITTSTMKKLVAYTRATFRENRTTSAVNNTLDEIILYADDDLSYEEMDYLRRTYRVIRGMDKPEKGETYLSTLTKFRETLAGDRKKYGMSDLMINNILTRMSFDYYIPSARTDAYSLFDSSEFNAELGSTMIGSKVDTEQYTEPMLELKEAMEDFYGWDKTKSGKEQDRKAPLLSGIRTYLMDKRDELKRQVEEFYQAYNAIKEDYYKPGEYVMASKHFVSYIEDMEYLEERAKRESGRTLKELLGEETYNDIETTAHVSFPQQMFGPELQRVDNLTGNEEADLSRRLVNAMGWWEMNDKEMKNFVLDYLPKLNDLYRYGNIPNREQLKQALWAMGIDIENYEEDDDF